MWDQASTTLDRFCLEFGTFLQLSSFIVWIGVITSVLQLHALGKKTSDEKYELGARVRRLQKHWEAHLEESQDFWCKDLKTLKTLGPDLKDFGDLMIRPQRIGHLFNEMN